MCRLDAVPGAHLPGDVRPLHLDLPHGGAAGSPPRRERQRQSKRARGQALLRARGQVEGISLGALRRLEFRSGVELEWPLGNARRTLALGSWADLVGTCPQKLGVAEHSDPLLLRQPPRRERGSRLCPSKSYEIINKPEPCFIYFVSSAWHST